MNNKNLLAKSIFIKMKSIVSLGDFVAALPLAVWCKHLRPNVSILYRGNGKQVIQSLCIVIKVRNHANSQVSSEESYWPISG